MKKPLIQQIAECDAVEDAALLAANNWRKWGDVSDIWEIDKIPRAWSGVHDFTIFFLTRDEADLVDEENFKFIHEVLTPYKVSSMSSFGSADTVFVYQNLPFGLSEVILGFAVTVFHGNAPRKRFTGSMDPPISRCFKELHRTLRSWYMKGEGYPDTAMDKHAYAKARDEAMLELVKEDLEQTFHDMNKAVPPLLPSTVLTLLKILLPGLTCEQLSQLDVFDVYESFLSLGDFDNLPPGGKPK